MSTPLFLDKTHKQTFQKIAMPVKLSESPEAWQRDIAGEIYKQLPFIGEYAVNIILDRVDAQRGYGFGSAHISNKSDAQMQDKAEQPSIRIPIVIRDYLMAPLDIFMDGSGVFPLTESRIREKLFRAETFELSTRKPSDKGLVDQLYPPMRSNYGMGGMGGDSMGMGKAAADAESARRAYISKMHGEAGANSTNIGTMKGASLIQSIASTIPEEDADLLVDQITKDEQLKVAAVRNPTFAKLAMTIAAAPRIGVEKTASSLVESIKPNVVQLQKLASGNFKVKWANSQAFAPQEGVVNPQEASQMAGGNVSGMKSGATITLSTEKAQKQSFDEPVFIAVDKFGKYQVQDAESNQEYLGWAIPIIDFEMHPLELYLFIKPEQGPTGSDSIGMGAPQSPQPPPLPNLGSGALESNAPPSSSMQTDSGGGIKTAGIDAPGSSIVWSVQDEIAGKSEPSGGEEIFTEIVEKNKGLPPQGSGAFFSVEGSCCVLPVTVQNGAVGPDGSQTFQAESMFGEPVFLQQVEDITAVQQLGEGTYAIPTDMVWIPLPGEPVMLAKSPEDMETTQEAQGMPNQVQVGSTGQGEFSLGGPPLDKVANEDKKFIKTAQAEFLLVAMGINPFEARGILKKAEAGHLVKCAGRPITLLSQLHNKMVKQAHIILKNFPYHLRQNLVKEASVIDDADTADKVLAMNFINPENISTFAKYLPDLDEASKKLAELLLAVRLGVGSVDEGAVERAMKGLESVIDGLKLLQQKTTA